MTDNGPSDKGLSKVFDNRWKQLWSEYQAKHSRHPCVALREDLSAKRLRMHRNLSKPEGSLAVQMRSERIGLADYLFIRRIPTFASPACVCGWARQTLKHILFNCPRFSADRSAMCRDGGSTDYRSLLSSEKGLRAVTRWFMKTSLLNQFSLAIECFP